MLNSRLNAQGVRIFITVVHTEQQGLVEGNQEKQGG
jgi:hypothetical protein